MTTTPTNTPDNSDLLATLKIYKLAPRHNAPGAWVQGSIAGHRFEALVFSEPAANAEFEIPGSNISKFWLDRNGEVVANFDRGWDIKPLTPMAKRITDLLAAGLAEMVYHE